MAGLSPATFSDIAGGVGDIFSGLGANAKAQYDILEGEAYGEAAQLALQNEQYTKASTAIKQAQQQRELTMSIGSTTAAAAGAGFSTGGSTMDLLRESAQQGALTSQVLGQQGLITEAGYKEQAQSYELMQQAAYDAASAEKNAGVMGDIMGGLKIAAGIAGMFVGGPVGAAVGGAAASAIGDAAGIGGLY